MHLKHSNTACILLHAVHIDTIGPPIDTLDEPQVDAAIGTFVLNVSIQIPVCAVHRNTAYDWKHIGAFKRSE